MANMKGLLDILKTPQGIGLLMSGMGSAVSGDPRPMNQSMSILGIMEDMNLQREMLKERARKKEAISKMPGILGDLQAYPGFAQPGKKQEAFGLLADAGAGEAVMSGLLGELIPKKKESDDIVERMRALGYPLTKEGYAEYRAAGGGADGMNPLQQGQLGLTLLQIQKMMSENSEGARAKTEAKATAQRTINRNLEAIQKTLDLVDKTEGTFLEPGIPFGESRRGILSGTAAMLGAFGLDKPEMGDTLDAYDQMNKELNKLVISRDTGDLGNLTDSKLKLVQDAMGSTKISPTALRSILLDAADTMLDEADIKGYEIPNRDTLIETFSARRKQKRKAPTTAVDVPQIARDVESAAGAAATRAADIARMGLEDLQALDIDALAADQLEALNKRLKALGK